MIACASSKASRRLSAVWVMSAYEAICWRRLVISLLCLSSSSLVSLFGVDLACLRSSSSRSTLAMYCSINSFFSLIILVSVWNPCTVLSNCLVLSSSISSYLASFSRSSRTVGLLALSPICCCNARISMLASSSCVCKRFPLLTLSCSRVVSCSFFSASSWSWVESLSFSSLSSCTLLRWSERSCSISCCLSATDLRVVSKICSPFSRIPCILTICFSFAATSSVSSSTNPVILSSSRLSTLWELSTLLSFCWHSVHSFLVSSRDCCNTDLEIAASFCSPCAVRSSASRRAHSSSSSACLPFHLLS
mmetsp:Transcript_91635/g.245493  ORF Transcript_91635/g.245493 Transcript_91635/m.245493 type:complete len:306 (+) Transcript_91635:1910-2827(+)